MDLFQRQYSTMKIIGITYVHILKNSFQYTEWDAQASEPQGLLFGNRYQLGNFDQCMSAPWSKKQPELKTKYCLAEIVLERTDKNVRRKTEKPYYPYQSALDFIEVIFFTYIQYVN